MTAMRRVTMLAGEIATAARLVRWLLLKVVMSGPGAYEVVTP
jgi:hypothetical protein